MAPKHGLFLINITESVVTFAPEHVQDGVCRPIDQADYRPRGVVPHLLHEAADIRDGKIPDSTTYSPRVAQPDPVSPRVFRLL